MKKILIYLFLIFGMFVSTMSFAAEEKKSIVVLPINVGMKQTSYAIYKTSQDMFAADMVTQLQYYSDLNIVDVNTGEQIIKEANLTRVYNELLKQYKQRYVIDYEKAQMISDAIGVNYIIFIHGGFDVEKSFLKSNWKYRCQWIWASPIRSSAQYNMHVAMIDVANKKIELDENIVKDIPMDNFQDPSPILGENMVAVEKIKKYTKPKAEKLAKKIHLIIYPNKKDKYSEKNTFVERYTPNGEAEQQYSDNLYNPQIPAMEINQSNEVNKTRADGYKKWLEPQL